MGSRSGLGASEGAPGAVAGRGGAGRAPHRVAGVGCPGLLRPFAGARHEAPRLRPEPGDPSALRQRRRRRRRGRASLLRRGQDAHAGRRSGPPLPQDAPRPLRRVRAAPAALELGWPHRTETGPAGRGLHAGRSGGRGGGGRRATGRDDLLRGDLPRPRAPLHRERCGAARQRDPRRLVRPDFGPLSALRNGQAPGRGARPLPASRREHGSHRGCRPPRKDRRAHRAVSANRAGGGRRVHEREHLLQSPRRRVRVGLPRDRHDRHRRHVSGLVSRRRGPRAACCRPARDGSTSQPGEPQRRCRRRAHQPPRRRDRRRLGLQDGLRDVGEGSGDKKEK